MRLRHLMPVLLTALLIGAGCSSTSSASRSRTGTPFASGKTQAPLQQYDTDPPAGKSGNTPPPVPPVPPAQGVSHVRGVSLSRIFGIHKSSDSCVPDSACTTSTESVCAEEACCVPKSDCGPGWFTGLFCKKECTTSCSTEEACVSPDACCTPSTGCVNGGSSVDRSCCVPSKAYCPPAQTACVPECRTTQQYCDPACPKICTQPECGQEGCTHSSGSHCGLLSAMFNYRDKVFRRLCGDHCTTEGNCQVAFDSCASEHNPVTRIPSNAYSPDLPSSPPKAPSSPNPKANTYAPGSPLSDRNANSNPANVPAVPAQPAPKKPQGVGTPQKVEDVPPVPMPGTDREISPMPQAQTWNEPWVEPADWPKLRTPSLARENIRTPGFQPSSWRR